LWTPAIRSPNWVCLYTKAGFEMVSESAHQSFGQDLIAEFWELPLGR